MDKGLTVPKWVLIVWPKISQMPQNLSAQSVCPSRKVLDFNEKRLHWASVVRKFDKAQHILLVYKDKKNSMHFKKLYALQYILFVIRSVTIQF